LVSGYTFNCDLPPEVDFLAKPFSVDKLAARLHALGANFSDARYAAN
jgi:hypothetical protein